MPYLFSKNKWDILKVKYVNIYKYIYGYIYTHVNIYLHNSLDVSKSACKGNAIFEALFPGLPKFLQFCAGKYNSDRSPEIKPGFLKTIR
jgi:hypothetical protein